MKILLISVLLNFAACSGQQDDESRVHSRFVVGLVTNNPNGMKNVEGFRQAMTQLGYVEQQNIEYRFAGEPTRGQVLEDTLERLVEERVNLIFTAGSPTGVAAHRITENTGIPVVFGVIAGLLMGPLGRRRATEGRPQEVF